MQVLPKTNAASIHREISDAYFRELKKHPQNVEEFNQRTNYLRLLWEFRQLMLEGKLDIEEEFTEQYIEAIKMAAWLYPTIDLQTLKEYIVKKRTLDDAILALFYVYKKDYLVKQPDLFHKAFEDISKETQIILLKSLSFEEDKGVFFCENLHQSLMRLENSGALPSIWNSGNLWYDLTAERSRQVRSFNKFDDFERKDLHRSAEFLMKVM